MYKKSDQKDPSSQQDLLDTKRKLSYTKYVLVLAFAGGLLGLLWSFKVAAIIFAVLTALWGVSTYIAFMHYLSAKKRQE